MIRYLLILFLLAGCKSPPPDRDYAPIEPVTEQPREPRPAPVAPHSAYVPYTNSQQDRLVERHELIGPPVVPGRGPFPLIVPQPAVSNWMTKAMEVQPKPMGTNQIKGSTILTKITTTDKDGKKFTAELTLIGDQTIHANDKMSLVMFAIYQTNFVVEFCTNLTDGIWHPMSSGAGQNTNSALAIFDLHEGTKPVNFYRRKPAP